MERVLYKALSQIVVPAYEGIRDIKIRKSPMSDYYYIVYFIDPEVKNIEFKKIAGDTESVWKMMNPPKEGDIIVDFKKTN